MEFDELLTKWSAQDRILQNDFDFIEPVLSTRCAVLHVISENSVSGGTARARVTRKLMEQVERFAMCAREAGRHQLAEGLVHRLRELEARVGETCWSWRVEEAHMFWSRAEHDTAKHLLMRMCTDMQKVSGENATQ